MFDEASTSMPLAMGFGNPVPMGMVATTVSPRTGLRKKVVVSITSNGRRIVIVLGNLRWLRKLTVDNFVARLAIILRY